MIDLIKMFLIGILFLMFIHISPKKKDGIWKKIAAILASAVCFAAAVYCMIEWVVPMVVEATNLICYD